MTSALSQGTHTIQVAGLLQQYHVAGRGPLCIVHSGGPGIDAGYLRMPLLETHLTMIYLDPIGTGGSDRLASHPFGYSVGRFAEQLLAFAEATEVSAAYLLGHSHGAFVLLEAALRRPKLAKGLILYAGSAFTGGDFMPAAAAKVAEFLQRHAGTPAAEGVARGWSAIPTIRTDDDYTDALRDLLPAYLAETDTSHGVLERLRTRLKATLLVGDSAPFDVRGQLPSLEVPTLVIAGAKDFILGPRYADAMAAALPQARSATFLQSGHFAHLEEPRAFADAVAQFLDDTECSQRAR